MTMNFVALDKNKHANLKLDLNNNFAHAANTHLAALSVREYGYAAGAMPIVFIKHPESGKFHSAALLGTESGVNLFYQADKWQSHYVPLNVQRYPFDVRGGENMTVVIDENAPQLSNDEGEPLFTEAGEPSELLENRQKLLTEIVQSEYMTQQLLNELTKHNLLKPAKVRVMYTSGEQKNLVGIYVIDEKALNGLADEVVLALHKNGALAMMYATLTSLSQINRLIQLSEGTDKPIKAMQLMPDDGEAASEQTAEQQAETAE